MSLTASRPRLRFLPRALIEDRWVPGFVERIIDEIEPLLALSARVIATEYPAAVDDMIQEARILLWELDLGRFGLRNVAYLRRSLRNRMVDVLCTEACAGLTTGWSKHASP